MSYTITNILNFKKGENYRLTFHRNELYITQPSLNEAISSEDEYIDFVFSSESNCTFDEIFRIFLINDEKSARIKERVNYTFHFNKELVSRLIKYQHVY